MTHFSMNKLIQITYSRFQIPIKCLCTKKIQIIIWFKIAKFTQSSQKRSSASLSNPSTFVRSNDLARPRAHPVRNLSFVAQTTIGWTQIINKKSNKSIKRKTVRWSRYKSSNYCIRSTQTVNYYKVQQICWTI